MPIKYVGRTTDFSGKTLWEIVGNLKNFGIGRLVKRQINERYPEPSFIRIVKVDTANNEEPRKVRVWAEKVFRGQCYPKLVEIFGVSYKADYRLIPKCEEEALWEAVKTTPQKLKLLPDTMEFPPLLKYMIKAEMTKNGESDGEPRLKIRIKQGRDNFYRKATENEEPEVEFSTDCKIRL